MAKPKCIFRGAFIRFTDLRLEESGMFVRVHVTCDLTDVLAREMGWYDLLFAENGALRSGWEGKLGLAGVLRAANVELAPSAGMREHTLRFDCTEIKSFSAHAVKGPDSESSLTYQIRCIMITRQPSIAAQIESFLATCGIEPGRMVVRYETQEKLPFEAQPDSAPADADDELEADQAEAEADPEQECRYCVRGVPFHDDPRFHILNKGKKNARHVPCAKAATVATATVPTLASVQELKRRAAEQPN